MYEEYFGLERPPFKITPDTSLFFEGGKRGDILAALVYAIHRGEGIIKVVGEVGSGKTMLCRMLQLKLPSTVEIVYIANPSVSAEDILFVIAHELELSVARDSSKHEVMRMLQEYLLQRHMENKQVVLFVEEAQGMPLDTLEEIRLLSNLETAEHKLLQIILFGQPELDQNLAQQSIRQLRERITHNFELEPLSQEEIHNYLNFRMRQVGYTGPELINSNVARKIEAHSEGLLRRINIIADKILLSAFAEGTHNLSPKHVSAAVNDSAFDIEKPRKSGALWWVLVLAAVALAVALYQTRSQWMAMAGLSLPAEVSVSQQDDAPATNEASNVGASEKTTESSSVSPEDDAASERQDDAVIIQADEGASSNEAAATETDVAAETSIDVVVETSVMPEAQTVQSEEALPVEEPVAVSAPIQVAARQQQGVDPVPVLYQEDIAPVADDALAPEIENAEIIIADTPDATSDTEPREIVVTMIEEGRESSDDPVAKLDPDNRQWLGAKLDESRQWLDSSERRRLSIQVMMRKKSAARELVYYLRNEWPLDISQTYLYEVKIEGRSIYRVFYSEFDSLNQAQAEIDLLPESVKINSPYVHSVSRMRRALL